MAINADTQTNARALALSTLAHKRQTRDSMSYGLRPAQVARDELAHRIAMDVSRRRFPDEHVIEAWRLLDELAERAYRLFVVRIDAKYGLGRAK